MADSKQLKIHVENVNTITSNINKINDVLNVLNVDMVALIDTGSINMSDEFKAMEHPKYKAIQNNLTSSEQRGIVVFLNKKSNIAHISTEIDEQYDMITTNIIWNGKSICFSAVYIRPR